MKRALQARAYQINTDTLHTDCTLSQSFLAVVSQKEISLD